VTDPDKVVVGHDDTDGVDVTLKDTELQLLTLGDIDDE
jgi:hypothetical protein